MGEKPDSRDLYMVLLGAALVTVIGLFIFTHNPESPSQINQRAQSESYGFRLTHDPVAGFTGILAVSTIFLWIVTRRAAGAAKLAADALPIIERAYVFLNFSGTMADDYSFTVLRPRAKDANPVGNLAVYFSFSNHGRTPAVLTEISVAMEIWQAIPASYPYLPTHLIGEEIVVTPTQSTSRYSVTKSLPLMIGGEIALPTQSGEKLYLIGRVLYSDVTGAKRETTFCYIYDSRISSFFRYGGNERNKRT